MNFDEFLHLAQPFTLHGHSCRHQELLRAAARRFRRTAWARRGTRAMRFFRPKRLLKTLKRDL